LNHKGLLSLAKIELIAKIVILFKKENQNLPDLLVNFFLQQQTSLQSGGYKNRVFPYLSPSPAAKLS
jgi:hypothetical protein